MPGRVVVLNGTASAGKTSLSAALRRLAPSMWVGVAQDDFAQHLVDRWVHVDADGDGVRSEGFTFVRSSDGTTSVEVGDVGARLLRGYRGAVGAIAAAGNDVVVDEAMFDAGGRTDWAAALHGLPVTWVKVACDLAICEARERARGDRTLLHGLARGIHDRVHADVRYDLVVDTSHRTAEECARSVLAHLAR